MGSGLAGGPLTGGLSTTLGPGATGTNLTLSGTMTTNALVVITTASIGGLATLTGGFTTSASSTMTAGASLTMSGGGAGGNVITLGSSTGDRGVLNNAVGAAGASATVPAFDFVHTNGLLGANDLLNRWRDNVTVDVMALTAQGRLDLQGTDSTGTPGAQTIDKGSGKSAIALGAAWVVITCNQCTAASRVMISMHTRDATGLLPIVVPAAGSFTVSVTANATAAIIFSWEVHNIV